MKKEKPSKVAGFLKATAQKVGNVTQKTVTAIKEGSQVRAEKKQVESRAARLKKYNPLFPEEFKSKNFNPPNLIQIVDDAVRKGVDVCEGAIGWLSKQKGVEVLHLYDEAVDFSGLTFLPAPVCDTVYYVNPHNRNKFVSMDTYFSAMDEEKLAELQHIAFCLGAKHYKVEVVEGAQNNFSAESVATVKGGKTNKVTGDMAWSGRQERKLAAEATFVGQRKPVEPTLSWFADDKNVLNLIKMRCARGKKGDISQYTIALSSSASMAFSTALKIDAALVNMKLTSNVQTKSKQEHSRKMQFALDF